MSGTDNELIALAKLHGGTVYTNRTMPDNPAIAFGNMAQLTAFADAIKAGARQASTGILLGAEEDEWIDPVFVEAQRPWPVEGHLTAAPIAQASHLPLGEIMSRVLAFGVLCENKRTKEALLMADEIKSMLATQPIQSAGSHSTVDAVHFTLPELQAAQARLIAALKDSPLKDSTKLTKADTVALWHAVDFFALGVREAASIDGISADALQAESDRVTAAKRALRKVNKLREQGL